MAQWIGLNQPADQNVKGGKDAFSAGDLITLLKNLDATDEEILRLTKM